MNKKKGTVPFFQGLIGPPESEDELLSRAWDVAGLTLGELGARVGRLDLVSPCYETPRHFPLP